MIGEGNVATKPSGDNDEAYDSYKIEEKMREVIGAFLVKILGRISLWGNFYMEISLDVEKEKGDPFPALS